MLNRHINYSITNGQNPINKLFCNFMTSCLWCLQLEVISHETSGFILIRWIIQSSKISYESLLSGMYRQRAMLLEMKCSLLSKDFLIYNLRSEFICFVYSLMFFIKYLVIKEDISKWIISPFKLMIVGISLNI